MSGRQHCEHKYPCPMPKAKRRYYGKLWVCPTCHSPWTIERYCTEGCSYWWVRWEPPVTAAEVGQ
jgi:hypothetical protein